MSLFRCKTCNAIENTALTSGYWGGDKRCSFCITGKWHGRFEKEVFDDSWEYYNGEYVRRKEINQKNP